MVPYFNINLIAASKSKFEKDFFKLINKAVFVKTIKNLRKCIRVDLAHLTENVRIRWLVADPTFQIFRNSDAGITAISSVKSKLKLNRSVYVSRQSSTLAGI